MTIPQVVAQLSGGKAGQGMSRAEMLWWCRSTATAGPKS